MDKELAKSREKDKINFHQNKLTSMGEMLENIAHQWRQPLSQINSAVSIIDDILYQNGSKDAKVEQKLSEIESLTTYMSKTIDDFKNLFDKKRSKEPFSLRDVIEKSIYILKGTLDSHNIEIDIDLDDDFKSYGYPSELQQVIVAILNNAKEALINKKMFYPEIYIRVDRIDEYNNIYICDNAGGIDVDIIDKIFEPYFTTKYKSKGTGLGLYISKLIIEGSLEGELGVKNVVDGACFHIKIKAEYGE
jgi:C4-dicarboxylate-specific signal transduction histidine kinase